MNVANTILLVGISVAVVCLIALVVRGAYLDARLKRSRANLLAMGDPPGASESALSSAGEGKAPSGGKSVPAA